MHSIHIEIVAITEFHEPKPYEYFPSIKVDAYEMSGGNQYLADNYKMIIQAIIAEIGE